MIVQLVIAAALVTIVSQILKAFAFDVNALLSIYIGLIVTNCILMGRLEAFAMSNKPMDSLIDGISNGLGYAWILIAVGFVRELFGMGQLLGGEINIFGREIILRIPQSFYIEYGGFYANNSLMILPPMALILVACIIWIQRARTESMQEK
jgi:Na+-transporting NADH:ubiquinone oxidoreductase subunit D